MRMGIKASRLAPPAAEAIPDLLRAPTRDDESGAASASRATAQFAMAPTIEKRASSQSANSTIEREAAAQTAIADAITRLPTRSRLRPMRSARRPPAKVKTAESDIRA